MTRSDASSASRSMLLMPEQRYLQDGRDLDLGRRCTTRRRRLGVSYERQRTSIARPSPSLSCRCLSACSCRSSAGTSCPVPVPGLITPAEPTADRPDVASCDLRWDESGKSTVAATPRQRADTRGGRRPTSRAGGGRTGSEGLRRWSASGLGYRRSTEHLTDPLWQTWSSGILISSWC